MEANSIGTLIEILVSIIGIAVTIYLFRKQNITAKDSAQAARDQANLAYKEHIGGIVKNCVETCEKYNPIVLDNYKNRNVNLIKTMQTYLEKNKDDLTVQDYLTIIAAVVRQLNLSSIDRSEQKKMLLSWMKAFNISGRTFGSTSDRISKDIMEELVKDSKVIIKKKLYYLKD